MISHFAETLEGIKFGLKSVAGFEHFHRLSTFFLLEFSTLKAGALIVRDKKLGNSLLGPTARRIAGFFPPDLEPSKGLPNLRMVVDGEDKFTL